MATEVNSGKKVGNCRYYEQKYPEVDNLVMVKVKSIAEMGAYVSLLEYDNIEGMILLSELSRKRIRSISKLIRVGKQEVCVVLRVDKEKGYIDLSKRRVMPEELQKCEERFNKSKAVHSIMRNLAETTGEDLEDLYQRVAWPLYKKFGHAFDAFKIALTEPEQVFDDNIKTPENTPVIKELVNIIQKRLKPQPVKIRADIEVTCFSYEGIDAIKKSLKAGEACAAKQAAALVAADPTLAGSDIANANPLKITLVAPPLYVIVTTSYDKTQGINLVKDAIKAMETTIAEMGGSITVKADARAVSARDDHSLNVLLEQLKEQNKEVDGDAGSDDEFS